LPVRGLVGSSAVQGHVVERIGWPTCSSGSPTQAARGSRARGGLARITYDVQDIQPEAKLARRSGAGVAPSAGRTRLAAGGRTPTLPPTAEPATRAVTPAARATSEVVSTGRRPF